MRKGNKKFKSGFSRLDNVEEYLSFFRQSLLNVGFIYLITYRKLKVL